VNPTAVRLAAKKVKRSERRFMETKRLVITAALRAGFQKIVAPPKARRDF
jgi:hypothetical protein